MDPEQIPLRDLHLPEAVGWWPLAPGWWLLIGCAAVLLALYLRKAWQRWRDDRPRRVALRELARLEDGYRQAPDAVLLATRLSELLRRTMLAYARRSEVAGLTGAAWLEWLDRGLDEPLFSRGPGRSLSDLPYRRREDALNDIDVRGLISAVRRRLKEPLPESA